MTCQRCHKNKATATVLSDILAMQVCTPCAIDALPFLGCETGYLQLMGGEDFGAAMDAYFTSEGGVQ